MIKNETVTRQKRKKKRSTVYLIDFNLTNGNHSDHMDSVLALILVEAGSNIMCFFFKVIK
jgi:hypothetical protein